MFLRHKGSVKFYIEKENLRECSSLISLSFSNIIILEFWGFSNFEKCQILIGGGGTKENASPKREARSIIFLYSYILLSRCKVSYHHYIVNMSLYILYYH